MQGRNVWGNSLRIPTPVAISCAPKPRTSAGLSSSLAGRRAPWLWGRVAGDALDLVAVGTSFKKNRGHRGRLAVAAAALAGVTAVDVFCGKRLSKMHS